MTESRPAALTLDSPILVVDPPETDFDGHPIGGHRDRRAAGVHIALQVATIAAAALAVGLGVFLLVRAAANNSFDGSGDDEATVEPGPEVGVVGDEDGSSSGSRRTSGVRPESNNGDESSGPAVLASRAEEDESDPAPAAPLIADGDSTDADDPADPLSPDSSIDLTPGELITGSTTTTTQITIPGFSTPSTPSSSPLTTRPSVTVTSTSTTVATAPTILPTTTRPSTTTSVTTSTPSSQPTTTATVAPTTSPTTAPTTAPTTTPTTAPTTESTNTIVTVPPRTLISAPADGATITGDTVSFTANAVIGLAQYCWTFSGAGDAVSEQCLSSATLTLDRTNFVPGSLTVSARAEDDGGTVLETDSVTVTIGSFSDALAAPAPGTDVQVDLPLLLRSTAFAAATEYCWTLTQGAVSSGAICQGAPTHRLADNLDDMGFAPGSLTIVAQTMAGGTIVASETTIVTLTAG